MAESEGVPEVRIPGSFETLYQRDYAAVVGLIYAMTGSRWVAEDLATPRTPRPTGAGERRPFQFRADDRLVTSLGAAGDQRGLWAGVPLDFAETAPERHVLVVSRSIP